MSLTTMYPALNNSPRTVLTAAIEAADTSITVADATALATAPNLAVLGIDTDAEIISYTDITGNVLSGVVRGVNGTIPGSWPVDTIVARNWTAYDAEAFRLNILDLDSAKQDTLTFDSTPTASSTNPVTSGGVKTAVDAKADNDIIADEFSTSTTYSIGNYCIHEGTLYRFTSAHSAGAWNAAHVTAITVGDELATKASELDTLDTKIDSIIQESVFTVTESSGLWYLNWYGAAGECPYTVALSGTDYVLSFTYTV